MHEVFLRQHQDHLKSLRFQPDPARGLLRGQAPGCHHAAFDGHFVGIRAEYRVEVRADIRGESGGPMLRHGLQGLHGQRIELARPSEWRPDPERLACGSSRGCGTSLPLC